MIKRITILALFLLLGIQSCGLLRVKSASGGRANYEEYFIDNGVMQYFVKPVTYKAKNYKLTVDFTFRDTITTSFASCKYSIFSERPIKRVDSLIIFCENGRHINVKNNERMFLEKRKKYHIRNEACVTFQEMKSLFSGSKSTITAFYEGNKIEFSSTKKATKMLNLFNDQILQIIELKKD